MYSFIALNVYLFLFIVVLKVPFFFRYQHVIAWSENTQVQITQEAEDAGRAFAIENQGYLSQQLWSLTARSAYMRPTLWVTLYITHKSHRKS